VKDRNSHFFCVFISNNNVRIQTQSLAAILPNGRALRVKIKVFDYSPQSPARHDAAIETMSGPWQCHLCGKNNLAGKGAVEDTSMEVEGGEKEDQDEGGPAGSRPKRKRTNVYSSLSEAVIKATSQARAEAFMAAPPTPQHQSKLKPKPLRDYVHPGAVAAEKAIAKGRPPEELVGNDGNLFYCRVCLGVVS